MSNSQLLQEADRCVKCGICLPHCPTYKVTLNEGDSPRGRIALMQGILEGKLHSDRAEAHLDRCLGCLACEAACPSQVKYGNLLDGYRATRAESRYERLIRNLVSRLPYSAWSGPLLRVYRFGGIRPLARAIGGKSFRRIDNLMPADARIRAWPPISHRKGTRQGRIALFTGCVGRISDRPALEATISVLTRLGYDVSIPPDQRCCGAIHQHAGDTEQAAALTKHNRTLFQSGGYDAVIYLASGCGAQLTAQHYPMPLLEVSQFLNQCNWPESALLGELKHNVALHSPCTLKHQLQLSDAPLLLLNKIPGIRVHRLDEIDCCGAAGSYLLQQPQMADHLQDRALKQLLPYRADIIATSNTGCALQLASGIREHGESIPVVHPVELVLQSLNKGVGDRPTATADG